MDHRSRTQAEHRDRATKVMKDAGYSPQSAVHKHERALHPGQPETKFANGGHVKGPKNVTVNVQSGANQQEKQQAMQQGMQMGARMAAQKMAQAGPPGAPPGAPLQSIPPRPIPPQMPPQGVPRPPGAGPMNKGGIVKVRSHTRRKAGGAC